MARGNQTARHEEDEPPVDGIDETEEDIPVLPVMSDVDYILDILIKRPKVTMAIQNEGITEFTTILNCQRQFGQFTFLDNGIATKLVGVADIVLLNITCSITSNQKGTWNCCMEGCHPRDVRSVP